jgi:hypothetical protein
MPCPSQPPIAWTITENPWRCNAGSALGDIVVGIVKAPNQGTLGSRGLGAKVDQGLVQVQDPIAQAAQQGHLAGKAPSVAATRTLYPHRPEATDLVVLEDGDGHKDQAPVR